jgi:[acyl-carrier-protein] S-malonyltransferase
MKQAAERLAPFLADTVFSPMSFPVVTNVDAAPTTDPERARQKLVAQVCAPVRWVQTAALLSETADGGVEVGPGAVLAGLCKRIVKAWPVRSTSTVDGVEQALRELAPA